MLSSKKDSAAMKDAIHRWASTHMLGMFAKFKQTTHKEADDTLKAQLTQQRDALTTEWSDENCQGQSAVLTLKLLAAFHEHSLLLAYGQQSNDHLRLVIQEDVSELIEHARETQHPPSLAKMFMAFRTKCADFTGKAATALKDSKHDNTLERTKADNQDFLKGLATMLASTSTAAARQRVAPAFDPTDPCR